MKNEIYVIYLIKDINYGQSHTFASLKDIEGIHTVVCDNSTNNYLNNFVEQFKNFKFLPMGYDTGKRIAITKALEYIDTQTEKEPVIFVIEEGSTVDKDFFERLDNIVSDKLLYFADIRENNVSTNKNGYNGLIFKGSLFDIIKLPQTVFTGDIDGNFHAQLKENNIEAIYCPELIVNKKTEELTPEQIEWNRRFSW